MTMCFEIYNSYSFVELEHLYYTYTLLNILSRLTFYFGKNVYKSKLELFFFPEYFPPPIKSQRHSTVYLFFYQKKNSHKSLAFYWQLEHSQLSIKVISKRLQNLILSSIYFLSYKVCQKDDMLFLFCFSFSNRISVAELFLSSAIIKKAALYSVSWQFR